MMLRIMREAAALLSLILFAFASSNGSGNEADPTSGIAALELDHVYICVEKEAPEAGILQKAGLRLASDTAHHTGQGTASVFFFFENAYLEFAWIEDINELEQADEQLADKFMHVDSGGSPFGLGFRRSGPSSDSLPFETRSYSEEWMKPGSTMEIAEVNHESEPEIFVVPPYMGWDSLTANAQNEYPELLADLIHPAGIKRLTGIRITGPGLPTESEAIGVLIEQGIVEFGESKKHVMELTFDRGNQGETIDARPDLPLIIRY